MKKLNCVFVHQRVVVLVYLLCLICSLIACDDKAPAPPSQHESEHPPEKDSNTQDVMTSTDDELEAYRQEVATLSPDEIIAQIRLEATVIQMKSKSIAKHLADNNREEAERIAADVEKRGKKSIVLGEVLKLRHLAGELSQQQISAMRDATSEMIEVLDFSIEVSEMAIKLTEEK